jgi:lysine-N-methylase
MRRPPFVGPRYVGAFQCTGSACPENCCQVGWRISVDEGHYRKLRRALGPEAAERSMRALPTEQRSPHAFALMVLDERGACRELDDERRCRLHARLGEDVLPDVCAIYPRVPSVVGRRRELATVLSCPEAARLALLSEDATDLVELPPALFPTGRDQSVRSLPERGAAPWVARFDDVRGTMYELLSNRSYPVASRIAFTLAFASNLGGFFSPERDRYDAGRFDEEMARMAEPAVLDAIDRQMREAPLDERFPAHFVLEILATHLAPPASASFVRIALAALEECRAEAGRSIACRGAPESAAFTASVDSVLAAHTRRARAVPGWIAERLEVCVENFARVYWLREWYLTAPSVLAHAQSLALRVAVLRFLLLGHPDFARAASEPDAAAASRLLDGAIVECAYGLARNVEQRDGTMDGVMQTFERARLHSLAHGMSLLRF